MFSESLSKEFIVLRSKPLSKAPLFAVQVKYCLTLNLPYVKSEGFMSF